MPNPQFDWRSGVAERVCNLVRDGRVLARFRAQCAAFLDEKKRDEEQLAAWNRRRKEHCERGLHTLAEFKARTEETERSGDDRDAIERTRPPEDTEKTWVFDYYQEVLAPDELDRLGSRTNGSMLIAFCVWIPPELRASAAPKLTVPFLFGRFTGHLHSPAFGRSIEPGKASRAERYGSLAAIHDARFPDRDPIDELHHINCGRLTEELRRREREALRQIVGALPNAAKANVLEWLPDVEADLVEHVKPPVEPRSGGGRGGETVSLELQGAVRPTATPEIGLRSRYAMPKVRLFELLIKLRVDQINRESAWTGLIAARAEVIAERAKANLTDAERIRIAMLDAGQLPPPRTSTPDGCDWIDGLREIDPAAYSFCEQNHCRNADSPGCLGLAEDELKTEDAPEWRRLAGDRYLDGAVWRFRTTPWRFVMRKLHVERAMPFTEGELSEAVRLVQLEQAEQVALAIRRFAGLQDDSGYTDQLLADFRAEYPDDVETLGLSGSGVAQAADRPSGATAKQATLPPAAVPKRPSEDAFKAWRLRDLTGLKTQKKIADAMSEQLGRKVHQGEVSRWLAEVDAYRNAGGIFPDLPGLRSELQSIDPNLIGMGARQDHLTPRQRKRRDPDAE